MRRILAMIFLLGAGFIAGFCVNPRAAIPRGFSTLGLAAPEGRATTV